MESEGAEGDTSGGTSGGDRFGVVFSRLQQKEHERLNTLDTGNEKGVRHSKESDFAEGSSQLVGKKRRRENEGSPRRGAENEEEAGPETLREETHNYNTLYFPTDMEDDIQIIRQRVQFFTRQVSEVLEAIKAYFLDAITAFKEGILQLCQNMLETWEEDNQGLRNVNIVNEEILAGLHEARDVLEKLQASASLARHPEACPTA